MTLRPDLNPNHDLDAFTSKETTDALAKAAERMSGLRARVTTIHERIAKIDEDYLDANTAVASKLVGERAVLEAELITMKSAAGIASERYANALIAWAQHISHQAERVEQEAQAQIAPLMKQIGQVRTAYETARGAFLGTQTADAEGEVTATRRLAELAEEVRPIRLRIEAATQARGAARATIASRFGEGHPDSPAAPTSLDRDRFVKGVSKWVVA